MTINSAPYRDFYRLFAEEASRKGWLRLAMMEVNEKRIAYDYNVQYAGNLEALKCSYDLAYCYLSPGHLLAFMEFRLFAEEGIKKINLLWGDFESKERWKPKQEAHYEIFIFNTDLYSRFLHFLHFGLGLYRKRRIILDIMKRAMRKMGFRCRTSELTRSDQK